MRGYKIKLTSAITIFVLIISLMSGYDIFFGEIRSVVWYFLYFGKYIFLIVEAVYIWNAKTTMCGDKNIWRFMLMVLCLSPVIILVYSIIPWAINNTSFPYISRGISITLFKCISYFVGVTLAVKLKDMAPKCGLYAAVILYVISLLLGVVHYRTDFLNYLNPSSRGDNTAYIELHEVAYIIGLYIIYYGVISNKKLIPKWLKIISIVLFLIAYKRIGMASVVAVYIYRTIFYRSRRSNKAFFNNLAGIILIFVSLVYVAFSVSSELTIFLQLHGIDMMGRDIIYSYFRQFCEFNIRFIGQGVGFVDRQFDYTTRADLYRMVSIKALHNDYMKMYIEIGFVGFLVWCYYWGIHLINVIKKRFGTETAFLCLLLIMYTFMTYTTDNTEGYFNYQLHLSLLLTTICRSSRFEVITKP